MYLRKVHIENIRSIAKLDWEIPEGREAGWHVVIGDNGSGKSSFLRSIALVLIPHNDVSALRENWNDWLRQAKRQGKVDLWLDLDDSNTNQVELGIRLVRSIGDMNFVNLMWVTNHPIEMGKFEKVGDKAKLQPFEVSSIEGFSAAYGPFRRFSGGDLESEKIFSTNPKLAAHLSIFGENIALTESLKWLKDLDYRQAKKKSEGSLLDSVKTFVNQDGFLPHHAKLTDISPDGVIFTDGDGRQVHVEELSDGYRSILSMTFELIRQMSAVFKPEQIFSADFSKIIAPGVVLIDEVDAHLHPTWQRRIGLWFREHFPNIQFIVTTHSPLVCQAAEYGTVFRLPAPGSETQARMIEGDELNQLLYGDVLDAYGTELFGEDITRSDAGQEKLERLARLNQKGLRGTLTAKEQAEQAELRKVLSLSSHVLKAGR